MSVARQTWLTVIGVAAGALFTVGIGVFSFIHSKSVTLHPDPQAVSTVQEQAPAPRWAEAVRASQTIARDALVSQNVPGMSVAVGLSDAGSGPAVVWAEGFGWANLADRVPVTPRTRFRIGHASKTLTSAAVGLLWEQQQLQLDDEIQKYVPEFPKKQWPITLRQVMGHVAGVRHYANRTEYMPTSHCARASEGLQTFAKDPLLFEPETQSLYSTFGWVLVSAAVESVAGEPFFTFMRTHLFEPLHMDSTTVDGAGEPLSDRTSFYEVEYGVGRRLAPAVDYSCLAGAAAFLSTPSDLVRFGLALSGGSVLKPTTVSLLQSPQRLRSGRDTEFGLGWTLGTVELAGEPVRMAQGANRTLVGGTVSFLTFPDRGLVVVVMSNLTDMNTRYIAQNIADAFERARVPRAR